MEESSPSSDGDPAALHRKWSAKSEQTLGRKEPS